MEYYIDAFRNYVNFQGRATRTQFWMFVLFNFIAGVVLDYQHRTHAALFAAHDGAQVGIVDISSFDHVFHTP